MTQLISPIPNETPSNAWTCPNCKKESAGNYCPWCGTKKPTEKICPNCGASYDIAAGYLFCSNCGANIIIMRDEISDSWNQIIAAIDDGTARIRYAVGAYKPLDMGQFGIINMQLAGFDLDERADGTGKTATTWIAKAQLPVTHRMNPKYNEGKVGTGMLGGWEKSELRQWLNDTVLSAIPDSFRNKMVDVKKKQNSFDTPKNEAIQVTMDRLWIPDSNEVFGVNAQYYSLFLDTNGNRIRQRSGSAVWWWLRSAQTSTNACIVYARGSNGNTHVSYSSGGVVVGFCL